MANVKTRFRVFFLVTFVVISYVNFVFADWSAGARYGFVLNPEIYETFGTPDWANSWGKSHGFIVGAYLTGRNTLDDDLVIRWTYDYTKIEYDNWSNKADPLHRVGMEGVYNLFSIADVVKPSLIISLAYCWGDFYQRKDWYTDKSWETTPIPGQGFLCGVGAGLNMFFLEHKELEIAVDWRVFELYTPFKLASYNWSLNWEKFAHANGVIYVSANYYFE